jgi:hypothetical protein
MAGEKRAGRRKDPLDNAGSHRPKIGNETPGNPRNIPAPESGIPLFFRQHALTVIIFLFSLFFIITISNPALYMNDEWTTANQLHQLDIGHQVTFSEGKYGTTQNGTVSAFYTYRQNILMYSLALPLAALPVVKLFGLFGDNFRLLIIMGWSLCLVLIALLIDTYYPEHSRIHGIRILFPTLVLALLLFMINVLLYKQFPFSAPDAPFEVAALVLTNHLLFALMVTTVFETFRLILKDTGMALFGTFAVISCSSYIFWAAAAKDHMLTATVLAVIIFFYLRYLHGRCPGDAFLSFVGCGLLIWVRPEVGFFITIFSGIFFCFPLLQKFFGKETGAPQLFRSFIPMAGAFLGGVPFFINNFLTSHNPLIPVFDLPRNMELTGSAITQPLPLDTVVSAPAAIDQSGLNLPATVLRLSEMFSHYTLSGFTFDNLCHGFIGTMTFPENGSIGFLILCPLVFLAIIALVLWHNQIPGKPNDQDALQYYLFIIAAAVFFSYTMSFGSMNTSHGIVPDMRYLSPAYIPAGLLSVFILSKTRFLKKPGELLRFCIPATLIVVPVSLLAMILFHPFGNVKASYFTYYEFIIFTELVLFSGLMILYRFYLREDPFLLQAIPYLIVLIIITVFSFQFMLTSIYGLVQKFNGYPFWIPLVREGFRLIITVNYLPPV